MRRSRSHRRDQEHVGALHVELEVVRAALEEHRRREGPEGFAVLDLQVHLHLGVGPRGSPRIERAPSARGPNSMRPDSSPTTCPAASARARRAPRARRLVDRARRGSRGGRGRRAPPRWSRPARDSCRAAIAPVAGGPARHAEVPVASRAARRRARRRRRPRPAGSRGGRRCRSRSSLPLATQFSATPPASRGRASR